MEPQEQKTTTTLHPFNGFFSRTTWISRYQTSKTSLNLHEARDVGVLGCSGISWTICKQSASRSRQITTSTPHRSIFIDQMLFLMPNQQCESTEGTSTERTMKKMRKVMKKPETNTETDVFRSSDSQLSEESTESVLRVTV